jgi:hypothetical protein
MKIKPIKAWAVVNDLYWDIELTRLHKSEILAKNEAELVNHVLIETKNPVRMRVVEVLITPAEVY